MRFAIAVPLSLLLFAGSCFAADEAGMPSPSDLQLSWKGVYRLAWAGGRVQPNDAQAFSFRLMPLRYVTADKQPDKEKNAKPSWIARQVTPSDSPPWPVQQLAEAAYAKYGLAEALGRREVECLVGATFEVICRAQPNFTITVNGNPVSLNTGLFGFVKRTLVEYEKSEIK